MLKEITSERNFLWSSCKFRNDPTAGFIALRKKRNDDPLDRVDL